MTPQQQYKNETGKSIWKIKDHTYTDEYSAWIKKYAKNSDSPDAKIIREFSNKLKQKGAKFNPKSLRTLSPDADDWNELINEHDRLNQENAIYGVLLYPKKGIGKDRLDTEMNDWIGSMYSYGHGSVDTIIKPRGEDWAVIYHITGWYNHFDLNEEYE